MSFVAPCFDAGGVRVFRLDAEAARRRLQDLAASLLRVRPDVSHVLLFGSLARGDAHPGSDADIIVVLDDGTAAPFLERLPSLQAHFASAGIGCDILAYTRAELDTLRREPGLVRDAMKDALTLASRSLVAVEVERSFEQGGSDRLETSMRVLSITITEELAEELPRDPAEQRHVLELGLKQWRVLKALDLYRAGGHSLAGAAEEAGVAVAEVVPVALAMGIEPDVDPAWLNGPLTLEDATKL